MPGNPPFLMLKNWHLAQLTSHVALASLLALKLSFVEAGSRQFVSPKVVCVIGHRMLWCRKLAYRGDHDPQHLTPKPVTDYCVWQVDDLPLSTSPPRRDPSLSDSLWALTPCITEGNYG